VHLREFFQHPVIRLPIARGSEDFQAFVDKLLDDYLSLLAQLRIPGKLGEELHEQRPQIESFCSSAKKVIDSAYAGQPADAYQHFSTGVVSIKPYLQRQALRDLGRNDLRFMFRVRRSRDAGLTREDLFHIPFENRYKVTTQRYSVPGLPCLYLSGSLYTCWAEMGQPPFHELQAAAFWLAPGKKVSIINFSDRPAKLVRYLQPDGTFQDELQIRELLANHVVLWPLMALCSVIVRHRDAPFKPEYIMPQLLLQWLTKEHPFDGICYFSMHVPAVTPDRPLPPCNLVFPAREIRAAGRCPHLRSLFRLTEPYGWELLRAIHAGPGMPTAAQPFYKFEFISGKEEQYHETEFGKVETTLSKIAVDLLIENNQSDPMAGSVNE
jgi:RES domain